MHAACCEARQNEGVAVSDWPDGFHYLPAWLDAARQKQLVHDVGGILEDAPLFEQRMPRTGAPLSVRMSNAGEFGWVTDRDAGYRYQAHHPQTGKAWPAIPARLLDIWRELTGEVAAPNLCLINYYDSSAKLGLHQDRGEGSMKAPVVSISLGDDAVFVVGGFSRNGETRRLPLHSGDVVWFGGPSRLIFHGVQGIRVGSSTLLREIGLQEGRINVTLRRIQAGD
jgi:DNA oxidative demethylase